jgi:hypothetical protein
MWQAAADDREMARLELTDIITDQCNSGNVTDKMNFALLVNIPDGSFKRIIVNFPYEGV